MLRTPSPLQLQVAPPVKSKCRQGLIYLLSFNSVPLRLAQRMQDFALPETENRPHCMSVSLVGAHISGDFGKYLLMLDAISH